MKFTPLFGDSQDVNSAHIVVQIYTGMSFVREGEKKEKGKLISSSQHSTLQRTIPQHSTPQHSTGDEMMRRHWRKSRGGHRCTFPHTRFSFLLFAHIPVLFPLAPRCLSLSYSLSHALSISQMHVHNAQPSCNPSTLGSESVSICRRVRRRRPLLRQVGGRGISGNFPLSGT